jgi:hypothetical protein
MGSGSRANGRKRSYHEAGATSGRIRCLHTHDGGTANDRIEDILLSPALRSAAGASGVFRRGVWPGVRPRKWDVYPELDPVLGGREEHAASDHAAIWVDLDLGQS